MKARLPPVDVWGLVSDGIEAPLRYGMQRGIKHMDTNLTDEQINRILEQQHLELMSWFADTFRFPE